MKIATTLNHTGIICFVCEKGEIVEQMYQELNDGPEAIIGPGSLGQVKTSSNGYFCEICGLKYAHLPKDSDVSKCPGVNYATFYHE